MSRSPKTIDVAGNAALAPRPFAFTLIELLVVIGIIVLLAGLLIPALNYFRGHMRDAAARTFMGTLQTGITGFGNDNRRALPPSYGENFAAGTFGRPTGDYDTWNGGELLAQALMGPRNDDGKTGYGYTTGSTKVYGPYIDLKDEHNLRARFDRNNNSTGWDVDTDEFWNTGELAERDDAYVFTLSVGRIGMPFLYYRAVTTGTPGNANFNTGTAIWSTQGRFDTDHNADLDLNHPIVDDDGDGTEQPENDITWWLKKRAIDNGPETTESFVVQLRTADYLLVHAGADNMFGTADDLHITGQENKTGF